MAQLVQFEALTIQQGSKVIEFGRASQHRACGTTGRRKASLTSIYILTVKVRDLFYNYPVRRRASSPDQERERVKSSLEKITLIHPEIAFSLFDLGKSMIILHKVNSIKVNGVKVFQTGKLKSVVSSFGALYGKQRADCMEHVQVSMGDISISGILSDPALGGYHSKVLIT